MIMPKLIPTEQLEKANGGESLEDQKKRFERGQLEDEERDEARQDRDAEGIVPQTTEKPKQKKTGSDYGKEAGGELWEGEGIYDMEKLEKWQPKFKVSTARGRKQREGYSNVGQHSGRQSFAHGYVEQMKKGDTPMVTDEQRRLDNAVVQLEKIAGLGAVADAAKKVGSAVSGAAKKLGGGGGEQASAPSVYDTAKVSGPKADSRDWKVQGTPAIDTSVYGKERERVRTDVTESQRAQRTGDPERKTSTKSEGSSGKGIGSRLRSAFGATKRGAKEFVGGLGEGVEDVTRPFARGGRGSSGGGTQRTPSATQWNKYSQRGGGNKAANPYGDASSRQAFTSAQGKKAAQEKARSYKSSSQRNRLGIKKSLEKAVISLQKISKG